MNEAIRIQTIEKERERDLDLPNEPFPLTGKLLPSYTDGKWSYAFSTFGERSEQVFPDETYRYDEMRKDCVFLGAYDGQTCVGLAILRNAPFKYMYLYDLKVNGAYRGRKIGAALIEKAKEICLQKGYRGIYTQAQDNNLSACKFYLKTGFYIGGIDTNLYRGTPQEGKTDILFYLDCEPN